MINLILNKKSNNNKRVSYAFYYLTKKYNESIKVSYYRDENSVNIFYGIEPVGINNIYIPIFDKDNIEHLYFNSYDNMKYASLEKVNNKPFEELNGNIIFNFDILYLSSYLLTCNEEYYIEKKDSMDRFLGEFSLRKDKIDIPFFNVNSSILLDAVRKIDTNIKFNDKKFEIFLTHDVDNVDSRNKYVFLHNVKNIILDKNKSLGNNINKLFSEMISNRHSQILNYIEIEKRRNAKSEFYFIEGKIHRLGKRYELKDILVQINELKSEKFVIGLHTNYFSYDNEDSIKDEIKAIEDFTSTKVLSCRNHYLRFKVPNTWYNLSNSGILCDSTIGYSDKNGFRAGIADGFIPFDVNENKLINIFEVPLVIMDGIIMEKNISFCEKWDVIRNILDEVILHKGTVSVLWHQRVIENSEYKDMYEKILDYVNEKSGSFVISDELIKRYNKQQEELNYIFSSLG
ncbi:MAG: hypothetical protein Q8900_01955 [Bacillota bacterium]|nr:hypothetical protein [Bacillota bacterium]